MNYLIAAISIGALGSLHCLGMCGPIVSTIHRGKNQGIYELLHHSGRILTYMLLGAFAGMLGSTFDLMGAQQAFSVTVGVLLILSVVAYPLVNQVRTIEGLIGRLSIKYSSWIHSTGLGANGARFLLGSANGILPCGLVYLGIAGAANTFTPWDGAFFMLAFGAGTIPALILVGRLAQRLSPELRSKARKLIPITVFVMGSLLLVRGMNLGVPYLSPKAPVESNEIADCH